MVSTVERSKEITTLIVRLVYQLRSFSYLLCFKEILQKYLPICEIERGLK